MGIGDAFTENGIASPPSVRQPELNQPYRRAAHGMRILG